MTVKILDIALNDLTRSFRSVFAIGMSVVAPLLLTGLIYFAFANQTSGDVSLTTIRVGVVNADQLPAQAVIDTTIGANIRSMFFDESVRSWIEARDYPNETAARNAVDRQEIGVAVIIPATFTERYLLGEQEVQVLLVSDPTLSIGPGVAEDMIRMMVDAVAGGGIAITTIQERREANGLAADPAQIADWIERYGDWYKDFQRDLFHRPEQAALVLVAPAAGTTATADPIKQMMGLMMTGQMIFFAFFTGAYAMMSILREDEEGTLARLFSTPINRTHILAGKFLAVFLTVLLQGLVLMTAGHFVFGIQWGDPLGVGLALSGQVVAAVGLGVLLISFVKTTKQGGPVLGGGLTVLGMLGGLFTANITSGLPEVLGVVGNFTPQGWVLKSWRLVLAGQPTTELLVPFAVTILLGVLMFVLGAFMFRKRFA